MVRKNPNQTEWYKKQRWTNQKPWCEICRCWLRPKKSEIEKHNRGPKHLENMEKRYKEKRREQFLQRKEEQVAADEMRKIEEAAMQDFIHDRASGATGAQKSALNMSKFVGMGAGMTNGQMASLNSAQWRPESGRDQLTRLNQDYGHVDVEAISPRSSPEPVEIDIMPKIPFAEDGWLYCTPKGDIKGPFKTEEMADWLYNGWFDGKLKVRKKTETTYKYLKELENPFNIREYKQKMEKAKEERKKIEWEAEQERLKMDYHDSESDSESESDSDKPDNDGWQSVHADGEKKKKKKKNPENAVNSERAIKMNVETALIQEAEWKKVDDVAFEEKKMSKGGRLTVETPKWTMTTNMETSISSKDHFEIDPIFGTAMMGVPKRLSEDEQEPEGQPEEVIHDPELGLNLTEAYGLADKKRKVEEVSTGLDKSLKFRNISSSFKKRKKRKRNLRKKGD